MIPRIVPQDSPLSNASHPSMSAIAWRDGALELLDQRVLPRTSVRRRYTECAAVAEANPGRWWCAVPRRLAWPPRTGVVLAARKRFADSPATWARAHRTGPRSSRRGATDRGQSRMGARSDAARDGRRRGPPSIPSRPCSGPHAAMHAEDIAANRRMGELGAALIESRCEVLTHCNAGALATAGYGTALGVVRAAHAAGRIAPRIRRRDEAMAPGRAADRVRAGRGRHSGEPDRRPPRRHGRCARAMWAG